MNRKKLFVSYRHKNKKFKDMLVYHLRVYEVRKEFDIWVDDRMAYEIKVDVEKISTDQSLEIGSESQQRVTEKVEKVVDPQIGWEIENVEMAVILVSNEYFEGDYVEYEKYLLRDGKTRKGTKVYLVLVSYVTEKHKEKFDALISLFGNPINEKPLPLGADFGRTYNYMKKLAEKIYVKINETKLKPHSYRSYRHYRLSEVDHREPQDLRETIRSGLYATLSLGFYHLNEHYYRLEFRFSISEQYVENPVVNHEVDIDQSKLPQLPDRFCDGDKLKEYQLEYGKKLGELLFVRTPRLRKEFKDATKQAEDERIPLRLRIVIGPSAQELYAIHWELLCHPDIEQPIIQNRQIWFSRYLMGIGLNWKPIHILTVPSAPRGGIMVINPAGADIDVEYEKSCIREYIKGLQAVSVSSIERKDNERHGKLFSSLNEMEVLHLVCTVVSRNKKPHIISTGENNQDEFLSKNMIKELLGTSTHKPRLIILQPPISKSGISDNSEIYEIAPAFTEAGVACVLTFQTGITRDSLNVFLASFYHYLKDTGGHIGASVCGARQELVKSGAADWAAPILIARQKTTRIWFESGFDKQDRLKVWPDLVKAIIKRKCLPIIGPRVFQKIIGSRDRIAVALADRFHYPLAHNDRSRMTQVARYISANFGFPVLHNQYDRVLGGLLTRDYRGIIADHNIDFSPVRFDSDINGFIDDISEVRFKHCMDAMSKGHKDVLEIFIRLVDFRLPRLITTSTTNILEKAIELKTQCLPDSKTHPWRPSMAEVQRDDQNEVTDKVEVYHLFGKNNPSYERILSEDDFFKFLSSIHRKKPAGIPTDLAKSLVTNNLLLLGFGLNDWDFRILLQMLSTVKESTGLVNQNEERFQVSVQLDPDDELVMDPYKAKEYLAKFLDSRNITIYWGSEDEFIRELSKHVNTAIKRKENGNE